MHSEARVDSTCGDLVWRCLVDSVSGRLADAECRTCTPCTLLLGTPPHFRLNVHVDCSVQSTAARAVVQGAGGRGNLVLHPHGVRVWATKLDGDGRVPLKIEGSRFDRQSLYRLRKLCGYFTQKLHPDTKLGFFRLTIHVYTCTYTCTRALEYCNTREFAILFNNTIEHSCVFGVSLLRTSTRVLE